jgi:hypothetical protein
LRLRMRRTPTEHSSKFPKLLKDEVSETQERARDSHECTL